MKRFKLFSPCALALMGLGALINTTTANAVKAYPGVIDFTQPDGTVLQIRMHGDENLRFATTEDGLMIIDNNGVYEYAVAGVAGKPVSSGIAARPKAQRTTADLVWLSNINQELLREAVCSTASSTRQYAPSRSGEENTEWVRPKYTFTNNSFPAKGEQRALVILVEYRDYKFSMKDPLDYYQDFLNGEDFTRDKGVGSARKYFIDNSLGKFQPTFDVYGPVPLMNNRKYYGGNIGGTDQHAEEMVTEALKYLDPDVDFSVYDHNNDGLIDNIYVIYAGPGEASSGVPETVWPHSATLTDFGHRIYVDGKLASSYGCSCEINNNRPDGIGTFVHEFSHVLGLPDQYNTNTQDETTPGEFSVLDIGNYNNNSRTPAGYSIHERYALEWMTPEEIYHSGEYFLNPIRETNTGFIMTTEENPEEFFLLESRTKEGWDKFIPYYGMLVWHIDFKQSAWDSNSVNNVKAHNRIDLVRADNQKGTQSYTGDPFPGSRNKTEFSTTTTPSLKSWESQPLNVTSLSNINFDRENGRVTFYATCTEERTAPDSVSSIDENIDTKLSLNGRTLTFIGEGNIGVYDISGRCNGVISNGGNIELEPGLYIVNGTKLLVR